MAVLKASTIPDGWLFETWILISRKSFFALIADSLNTTFDTLLEDLFARDCCATLGDLFPVY